MCDTLKLVRFGEPGDERAGTIDDSGRIRDLSAVLADRADEFSPDWYQRIRTADIESLPVAPKGVRLGPCVRHVGKFVCVGLNYADHAREAGATPPREPVLFMKAVSSLSGPFDPILIPPGATKVDWEAELGVVIGRRAKNVGQTEARRFITGFCVVNDVSERAFQLEGTGQWLKGKSADSFGPVGPCLVTCDEVPDPQRLDIWLSVNGVERQRSNTAQMLFTVDFLVSYISRFMTLLPGDIISTGTPAGVGMSAQPQTFLRPGDVVSLGIAGLGEQRQQVLGHDSA